MYPSQTQSQLQSAEGLTPQQQPQPPHYSRSLRPLRGRRLVLQMRGRGCADEDESRAGYAAGCAGGGRGDCVVVADVDGAGQLQRQERPRQMRRRMGDCWQAWCCCVGECGGGDLKMWQDYGCDYFVDGTEHGRRLGGVDVVDEEWPYYGSHS